MVENVRPFRHPCATEGELKAYAKLPALHKSEVVALIQGFTPRWRVQGERCTYLDDYADYVQNLNAAEKEGKFRYPISPRDLVRIATKLGIPLPEPFLAEVCLVTPRSSRLKVPCLITEELIRPLSPRGRPRKRRPPLARPLSSSGCPRRRRTPLARGLDADVAAKAKEMARRYVLDNGRLPPKKFLNKKLADMTGRNVKDILRRYDLQHLLSDKEFQSARREWRMLQRGE